MYQRLYRSRRRLTTEEGQKWTITRIMSNFRTDSTMVYTSSQREGGEKETTRCIIRTTVETKVDMIIKCRGKWDYVPLQPFKSTCKTCTRSKPQNKTETTSHSTSSKTPCNRDFPKEDRAENGTTSPFSEANNGDIFAIPCYQTDGTNISHSDIFSSKEQNGTSLPVSLPLDVCTAAPQGQSMESGVSPISPNLPINNGILPTLPSPPMNNNDKHWEWKEGMECPCKTKRGDPAGKIHNGYSSLHEDLPCTEKDTHALCNGYTTKGVPVP